MKKSNRLLYAVMLLLLPVICSCKKEETTSADCKTCRALGSLGTIEKRVCSPDEEQAFRNEMQAAKSVAVNENLRNLFLSFLKLQLCTSSAYLPF